MSDENITIEINEEETGIVIDIDSDESQIDINIDNIGFDISKWENDGASLIKPKLNKKVSVENLSDNTFSNLIDTPSVIESLKILRGKSDGSGLEFIDPEVIEDVNWGEITGTLSDQTDLQGALDLKYDSVDFNTDFDTRLGTKDITDLGTYSHTSLTDIGTNTHAQIDTALTRLENTSGTNTGDVTVTDSSEIDFTLTGQDITASLIAGSIDETKLDTSVNASLDLADSALQSETDPIFVAWEIATDYVVEGDNVSVLVNDAGYLTEHQSLADYWKNDGSSTATGNWDLGDNNLTVGGGFAIGSDDADGYKLLVNGTSLFQDDVEIEGDLEVDDLLSVSRIASNDASTAKSGRLTLGTNAYTSTSTSNVIGDNSYAYATNSFVFGHSTQNYATEGISIGNNNQLYSTRITTIGHNLINTGMNSIALGEGYTNSLGSALTVGFGQTDFSVSSGQVNVHGDLTVDTDTLFVDSVNHRAGVGTASPASPLQVVGTNGLFLLSDNVTNATPKVGRIGVPHYTNAEEPIALFFGQGATANSNVINIGGGTNIMNAVTNIRFFTTPLGNTLTGTERIRIDGSGNVGIGTTAPSKKFHVADTYNAFIAGSGLGLGANFYSDTSVHYGTTGANSAIFFTNNLERMRIAVAGNVGIGTTTPSAKLDVNGDSIFQDDMEVEGNILADKMALGTTIGSNVLTVQSNDQTAYFISGATSSTASGRAFTIGDSTKGFATTIFYSNSYIGLGSGNATRDTFIGRSAVNTIRIGSDYDGTGTGHLVINNSLDIYPEEGYGISDGGLIAAGQYATASANHAIALGEDAYATGSYSTVMGYRSTASNTSSVAIGEEVTSSGMNSLALGYMFENDVAQSFAVGFGQKDFEVRDGEVEVFGTTTSEQYISTADTVYTYDGDFVDTATIGTRVKTYNNDGTKYTSFEDDNYVWTLNYDVNGRFTGRTVTEK